MAAALVVLACWANNGDAAEPAKSSATAKTTEKSGISAKTKMSPEAVRAAFALPDIDGKKHSPAEWHGKKAVLVFFIATECPVSNFYAPDFARLAKEYAEKGIVTYGVHCDADLTATDAAAHAKEYGLKFPVLLDPKQKLAAAVGAKKRPKPSCFRLTGR